MPDEARVSKWFGVHYCSFTLVNFLYLSISHPQLDAASPHFPVWSMHYALSVDLTFTAPLFADPLFTTLALLAYKSRVCLVPRTSETTPSHFLRRNRGSNAHMSK
jgi:hypothetical protein